MKVIVLKNGETLVGIFSSKTAAQRQIDKHAIETWVATQKDSNSFKPLKEIIEAQTFTMSEEEIRD